MVLALRLLRIAAATAVCILLFTALFELFNTAPSYFFPPESVTNVEVYRRNISLLDTLTWGLFFRGPGYLFWGTVPLLLTFLVFELLRVRHAGAYCLVWMGAGLIAAIVGFSGFVRPGAAIAAALIAGFVYWLLAGRSAGAWIESYKAAKWSSRKPIIGGRSLWDLAAYAVLAFLAFQTFGYLHYAGKLFWVSYVSAPSLGTPPFRIPSSPPNKTLTAFQKVALLDFPDPASCLQDGAGDLSPESLKRMDWDKIDNDAEAQVCIFRLLGSYEDLSHETGWFESQGLHVSDGWSSARPFKDSDGTLRVTGSWSIRENGPMYPTKGIIRRLFRSIPYGMGINASWSGDGKTLLHVTIGFSTL